MPRVHLRGHTVADLGEAGTEGREGGEKVAARALMRQALPGPRAPLVPPHPTGVSRPEGPLTT